MAVTEYTWNPLTDSVIEETDGAGNVQVEYTNEPAMYGPLISERRAGVTSQYHFDALGSTRALTNDAQTVTDTFTYDAWGNEMARTGTTETPFRWVGCVGYAKRTSEMYSFYVRQRHYQPQLSRWYSTDPFFYPLWTEQYTYAINSPIFLIDASGMTACKGTPTGIVEALGRGKFIGLNIRSVATSANSIYSTTSIAWSPLNEDSFYDSEQCICCCDEVGFIQIAKQTVFTNSGPTNYWLTFDWKVDSDELFYPTGTSGGLSGGENANPCPPWSATPMASMVDSPRIELWPWIISHLLSQEFEVCAACVSGNEGADIRVIPPKWPGTSSTHVVRGVTVYGCLHWSHVKFWDRRNHIQHTLYMARQIKNVTAPLDALDVPVFNGEPPSDIFKKVVGGRVW